MNNTHYKARLGRACVALFDIILVIVLFLSIREYLLFGHLVDRHTFNRIEFSLWHFIAILVLSVLWNRIFAFMGMYHFRRRSRCRKQLWQIFQAATLGVATMYFGAGLIGITGIGGRFSLIFWLSVTACFLVYRLLLYGMLFFVRTQEKNIRHVVIVGVNPRSIEIMKELRKPELGIKIVGFIDDISRKYEVDEMENVHMVASLEDFENYISRNPVDEVLITLPIRSYYDEIARIIETSAKQGLKSRLITNFFDLPSNVPCSVDSSTPAAAINYAATPITEFQRDVKRIFDAVVSATALIIFSPLLLVIGLLIAIEDGFPVVFRQERIGMNKRRFKIYKFRTMVRDAEKRQAALEAQNEMEGATFKITNDPRITKTGNWLRRTSLDELPQLVNVLQGTMSLVGPRPLPLRDFELFYNDSHRRRFSVKPGITGLWQVSGRNEINFEEWMRLDLQYIDTWSPLLELKILLWTIPAVLTGRGAK